MWCDGITDIIANIFDEWCQGENPNGAALGSPSLERNFLGKEVQSSANSCSLHLSCSSREQKIRTDNIIKRIKLNAPNSRSSILSKRDVGGDYHPLGKNVSPLFCIRKVSSKQTLRYMYAHKSCAFVGPIVVNEFNRMFKQWWTHRSTVRGASMISRSWREWDETMRSMMVMEEEKEDTMCNVNARNNYESWICLSSYPV